MTSREPSASFAAPAASENTSARSTGGGYSEPMSRLRPSWNIKSRNSRKRRLLHKYGPNCVSCREAFEPSDLTMDHIVALARGGCNCIKNLQLMCKPCNGEKGSRVQPSSPAAEASRPGHTKEDCPGEERRSIRRKRARSRTASVGTGRLQVPLQLFSLRNPTCVRCGQHVPANEPCLC